jgi:hypothetical protein
VEQVKIVPEIQKLEKYDESEVKESHLWTNKYKP